MYNIELKKIGQEDLHIFWENSSLIIPGLYDTQSNLQNIAEAFISEELLRKGVGEEEPFTIFSVKGADINNEYHLKGQFKLPADLTCLIFNNDQFNMSKLIIKRFAFGGKWFDDFVSAQ